MSKQGVPYLCGGILFTLLLEARKTRQSIRNRNNNGSDGLRDMDLMVALVETLTGEDFPSVTDNVMKKQTSDYRKCVLNGNTYISFSTKQFSTSFNTAINKKDPDILARMSGFVEKYISISKKEWLVKAILDTIVKDENITENSLFGVSEKEIVAKRDLPCVTEVDLPIFLLSVFRFIINERIDNTKGRDTFLEWHTQTGERAPWKFSSNIGDGITETITIKTASGGSKATKHDKNDSNDTENLELPQVRPQENIPYSDEDKALLDEFISDYDEIMLTLIKGNYADFLIDMSLPAEINKLYSSKWNKKADSFENMTLKSHVFGLLGELNQISTISFPKPYMLRQCRTAIRNYYVKLHPETFDSAAPLDVFLDDWNDGEF